MTGNFPCDIQDDELVVFIEEKDRLKNWEAVSPGSAEACPFHNLNLYTKVQDFHESERKAKRPSSRKIPGCRCVPETEMGPNAPTS